MRQAGLAAGLALAFAAAACSPTARLPSEPDLTPVPGAVDPVAGASFGPPSAGDITRAVAALDALVSYRYIETTGVPPTTIMGIVVNGDPHRVRTDTMAGTAVTMSLIEIGPESWISVAGSAYQADGAGLGGPDDPAGPVGLPIDPGATWEGPVAGEVESIAAGLDGVTDLGVELHDGVPARHLQARATDTGAVDENGDPLGEGFSGVVDAWIAVDGGYLAGVRAVGTQSALFLDEQPSTSPEAFRFELAIEGANDAGNRVDEPATPDPTVLPSADPEIAALLDGIDAGFAGLTSYVVTMASGPTGADVTATITVVNRPVHAMLMETGGDGNDAFSTLVIGERSWSREGTGPWTSDPGGEGGACPSGGGDPGGGDPASCSIASIIGIDQLRDIAGAFTIVDRNEMVGTVPVTHLRSASGLPSMGVSVPGRLDIWIANDGGRLLRYAFAGQGMDTTLDVSRINDPTIVLEPPADEAVSPQP